MVNDDFDRQEVDRLVRALTEPTPQEVPKPAVVEGSAELPPGRPVRHVSRWTSVRILMPVLTAAKPRRTFASAISLPNLAAFQLPVLSDESWRVRIVHGWVVLGLLLRGQRLPRPNRLTQGLLQFVPASTGGP